MEEKLGLTLRPEIINGRERYGDCAPAPRSLLQVPYQVLAHVNLRTDYGQLLRCPGPE